MIIKKGDQEIELANDEVGKLVRAIVDPPAGDWTGIRVLNRDVDLTPERTKVGGRYPEPDDLYWLIDTNGVISSYCWNGESIDYCRFENGSAFWKKHEAETELQRRRAEYLNRSKYDGR